MFYYLSLGTNIQPESNAAKMIVLLSKKFGPIISYPFIYTVPESISTKNHFLNSLAIIYSLLPEHELKAELNSIEERLGRDRNDPERSKKDRTADIDILGCSKTQSNNFFLDYKESYIRNIVEITEDARFFPLPGLAPSERPATIDFDRTTGNIRVIDNGTDSLKNWHKPALMGQ